MFETEITSQGQALCHLLVHTCLKDGRFSDAEIDKVAEIFVQFGLERELNFKDEVVRYRGYINQLVNEQEYLEFLAGLIMPVNELAIFSWCAEIALTDDNLSVEEEAVLVKIADALKISDTEADVIIRLMVQRRIVISDKIC